MLDTIFTTILWVFAVPLTLILLMTCFLAVFVWPIDAYLRWRREPQTSSYKEMYSEYLVWYIFASAFISLVICFISIWVIINVA